MHTIPRCVQEIRPTEASTLQVEIIDHDHGMCILRYVDWLHSCCFRVALTVMMPARVHEHAESVQGSAYAPIPKRRQRGRPHQQTTSTPARSRREGGAQGRHFLASDRRLGGPAKGDDRRRIWMGGPTIWEHTCGRVDGSRVRGPADEPADG